MDESQSALWVHVFLSCLAFPDKANGSGRVNPLSVPRSLFTVSFISRSSLPVSDSLKSCPVVLCLSLSVLVPVFFALNWPPSVLFPSCRIVVLSHSLRNSMQPSFSASTYCFFFLAENGIFSLLSLSNVETAHHLPALSTSSPFLWLSWLFFHSFLAV